MIDLALDDFGVLKIANGDFEMAICDNQHVWLLLNVQPGQFTQYPTCGIGLPDIILDNEILYWQHKTREQLNQDGLVVSKLELNQENLQLHANY